MAIIYVLAQFSASFACSSGDHILVGKVSYRVVVLLASALSMASAIESKSCKYITLLIKCYFSFDCIFTLVAITYLLKQLTYFQSVRLHDPFRLVIAAQTRILLFYHL